MIDRRTFLHAAAGTVVAIGAGAAIPVNTARAQQSLRSVPRVGILHPASVEASAVYQILVPRLRELGYTDGVNIVLDRRSGNGNPASLPALAADLVRQNPEVLVAVGPPSVKAAMSATRTIPIVAIDLETDPVASGWIANMARPSGNVTGFFLDLTAMSAKWLQLLREAVPGARQIAVLWDTTSGASQIDATRIAAKSFAIDLRVVPITNWDRFDAAINTAARNETQALMVLSSPTVFQYSVQLADFTREHAIPAITPFRPFAEAGGLLAYGPNLQLYFRRPAAMIDRILRGAKSAELAVEQPTDYELVINLKTATALRLSMPQGLLLRANEVIR